MTSHDLLGKTGDIRLHQPERLLLIPNDESRGDHLKRSLWGTLESNFSSKGMNTNPESDAPTEDEE
jgi:hypothetical protein